MDDSVGFIGLGVMGRPMALTLLRAGASVVAWNRSSAAADLVRAAGAVVVDTPAAVFSRARVVLVMLAHEEAVDATLGRPGPDFAAMVRDRTLVHMGTTAPEFSQGLAADVLAAGGEYVECPVSGSRLPAETGELVAMMAGPPEALDRVRPVIAPMCRTVLECGAVPKALQTKLAVNVFLITMVTGLAEAFHLAAAHDLDLGTLQRALDSGPMSSAVSRVKLDMLERRDFAVQAAITDVYKNTRLITRAARRAGVATPLTDACRDLYRETEAAGRGGLDMAAVVTALEDRTTRTTGRGDPVRPGAPSDLHP